MLGQSDGQGQGPQIKLEHLQASKNVECECGGVMFSEKMMFKRISAILSPTGKEEVYPMQVVVCESCGKVPLEFNPYKLVPEKYIAKKKIVIK